MGRALKGETGIAENKTEDDPVYLGLSLGTGLDL